jgi:hypothetical protein
LARQKDSEDLTTQYLLGTSSEEEQTLLEERFFSDDDEFEELEIVEEELIDRYVRGELSAGDRSFFEQRLSKSPRLRERVEFAKLLKAKVAAASVPVVEEASSRRAIEAPKQSWWKALFGIGFPGFPGFIGQPASRVALAVPMALVLVGSVALILGWMHLRNESRRISAELAAVEQRKRELEQQAANQRSQTEQLASDLQEARNQQAAQEKLIEELRAQQPTDRPRESTTAFLSLIAGTRSVGQSNTLSIGPNVSRVRLSLPLAQADYPKYKVTVRTPEGNAVHQADGLIKNARTKTLTIQVPAGGLNAGDYIVNVEGVTPSGTFESVADYSFRLIKKP